MIAAGDRGRIIFVARGVESMSGGAAAHAKAAEGISVRRMRCNSFSTLGSANF